MFAFASNHARSGARAALASFMLTIAASGGGCTLLVGGELSDKPSEATGSGGGGSSSSVSVSSSTGGGLMCAPDTANCDGFLVNGCETKLKTDVLNCGACNHTCQMGGHCKEGKCG